MLTQTMETDLKVLGIKIKTIVYKPKKVLRIKNHKTVEKQK